MKKILAIVIIFVIIIVWTGYSVRINASANESSISLPTPTRTLKPTLPLPYHIPTSTIAPEPTWAAYPDPIDPYPGPVINVFPPMYFVWLPMVR